MLASIQPTQRDRQCRRCHFFPVPEQEPRLLPLTHINFSFANSFYHPVRHAIHLRLPMHHPDHAQTRYRFRLSVCWRARRGNAPTVQFQRDRSQSALVLLRPDQVRIDMFMHPPNPILIALQPRLALQRRNGVLRQRGPIFPQIVRRFPGPRHGRQWGRSGFLRP